MASTIPFETSVTWQGLEGLQLNKALDQLTPQELARFDNLVHSSGPLRVRLGQDFLATGQGGPGGAGIVHSVRRMNDPRNATYTRFWGVGTDLYRGQSGFLAQLDSGYSGDPVTFLTVRPPQSGEPWMVCADRTKVRKASRTSSAIGVGLNAPTSMTAAPAAFLTTRIASFDVTDNSQASFWRGYGGFDTDGVTQAAPPALGDVTGVSGTAVQMTTLPGGATKGFLSAMVLAHPMDLTALPGGVVSDDQDIIHIWLRVDQPTRVEEIRLYFVVSPLTDSQLAVPGTLPDLNTAAYVRAYRASDYSSFVATEESAVTAGTTAADRLLSGLTASQPAVDVLQQADHEDADPGQRTQAPSPIPSPDQSVQIGPGANVWKEFGKIGLPIRKLDFTPVGTAGEAGTDWSTVTGLYITVLTTGPYSINVSFDDAYLTGGFGPDTSDPSSQKYDYRATHVDPRTGAESNGTAIFADTLWLDVIRQPINLAATPAGDAAIRQNFYRRGGTVTDNWRYVGTSSSDGGIVQDTLSDLALVTASPLPTDHFRPVATVDANGNTVLNQAVPIMFGPFDDGQYCALGDPYRPGHLYGSIPGEIDHWPSTGAYAVEVCSPSEELMNGGVWADQGFVLSREQGYAVRRNTSGGEGLTVAPTGVKPGLAARWGFCIGPGGIYYVASDGIRVTGGGDSTLLSDQLRPLFHGQSANGYAPIDWAATTGIRLALHDLELWFTYVDTGAVRRCFIFSLLYRYWRSYTFGSPVTMVYSDELTGAASAVALGAQQLILGGLANIARLHANFSDSQEVWGGVGPTGPRVAITGHWRTGSWAFERPRAPKLLGDVLLEADLKGTTVTLQAYRNVETLVGPAITRPSPAAPPAGRQRYAFDGLFPIQANGDPEQGFSVALDGTLVAPVDATPEVCWIGCAVTPLPDVTQNRTLVWDTWGSLSDKYLKGVLIDADTYGTAVNLQVVADGVVARTLILTHSGRRAEHYSFTQVLGRVFRLQPTSSLPIQVYAIQPIFDEEPLYLSRWETQLLDFNLPASGWGSILSGDICYRALVACTLTIQCYNSEGVQTAGISRPLAATGGVKVKRFVAMPPNKGVLFKLVFTAPAESEQGPSPGMALYQEESRLRVKPWDQPTWLLKPFGNDDTDETRAMTSSEGAAERAGGGS